MEYRVQNDNDALSHGVFGQAAKKAHKYISRTWKKGKWVYQYKITGKGYKKDAEASQLKADQANTRLKFGQRAIEKTKSDLASAQRDLGAAQRQRTKTAEAYNTAKTREQSARNIAEKQDKVTKKLTEARSNAAYRGVGHKQYSVMGERVRESSRAASSAQSRASSEAQKAKAAKASTAQANLKAYNASNKVSDTKKQLSAQLDAQVRDTRVAETNAQRAQQYQSDYYNKSMVGKVDKAVQSVKSKAKQKKLSKAYKDFMKKVPVAESFRRADYLKKNNIDPSKPEDLEKIVQYMDDYKKRKKKR